jgi:hypothetical protein
VVFVTLKTKTRNQTENWSATKQQVWSGLFLLKSPLFIPTGGSLSGRESISGHAKHAESYAYPGSPPDTDSPIYCKQMNYRIPR